MGLQQILTEAIINDILIITALIQLNVCSQSPAVNYSASGIKMELHAHCTQIYSRVREV